MRIIAAFPTMVLLVLSSFQASALPSDQAANAAVSAVEAVADSALLEVGAPLKMPMPLELTAKDFVTKVYGVFDSHIGPEVTVEKSVSILDLAPKSDESGLWVETSGGYAVSYYGMTPDVAAMAAFDHDSVASFGFFFLFPYTAATRDEVNLRQAAFCGALLQELHDMGVVMLIDPDSDALFDTTGSYEGNWLEVSLRDETDEQGQSRFVLNIQSQPGAFTAADDRMALE